MEGLSSALRLVVLPGGGGAILGLLVGAMFHRRSWTGRLAIVGAIVAALLLVAVLAVGDGGPWDSLAVAAVTVVLALNTAGYVAGLLVVRWLVRTRAERVAAMPPDEEPPQWTGFFGGRREGR